MASPCERYCACGGLVAPDWSTGKQRGKVLVVGPERGLSWTGRGALERVRRRADLGLHAAVSIVARGQIKSTEIGDVRVKVGAKPCLPALRLRLRGGSYGRATHTKRAGQRSCFCASAREAKALLHVWRRSLDLWLRHSRSGSHDGAPRAEPGQTWL